MPKITLYVLKAETGKRYVGTTNDLARHLFTLRQGKAGNSQMPRNFGVLLTESYPDKATAQKREKFLKSGPGIKWLDEYERSPTAKKS